MKFITLLIAIISLQLVGQSAHVNDEIPKDFKIEMARTLCMRTCPEYTVVVNAAGEVTFTGKQFVKVKGIRKWNISPNAVAEIVEAAQAADFFSVPNEFYPGARQCMHYATDLPHVLLTIKENGRMHAVDHYPGCLVNSLRRKQLSKLHQLEELIDRICQTHKAIGTREERRNNP